MRTVAYFISGPVAVVPLSLLAKADQVDFPGTWTLNQDKSVLGENGQRRQATTLIVQQKR